MPPRPRSVDTPARRLVRRMLLLVFSLHIVAIAGHQLAGVDRWPERWRRTYLGVWTALTVVIVAPTLVRVRQMRRAARHGPPA